MKTLVAFSFDDGRKDNYTVAIPILKARGLPATFNITAGYVDGSMPEDLRPSPKPAMSVNEILDISSSPLFEIALHGNDHLNTLEDILAGKNKITEWLHAEKNMKFGFASPGSDFDVTDDTLFRQEPFISEITYIRMGLRNRTWIPVRVLSRKIGRAIHCPLFYRVAYADTLLDTGNGRIVYSVPVMGDVTAHQVVGLIRLAERKRKSLIIMLHSIEDHPSDLWSWNTEKFSCLCDFLHEQRAEGKLDICTVEKLSCAVK